MLGKGDWKVHKDSKVNLNRNVPHGEAVSTRRRRSVGVAVEGRKTEGIGGTIREEAP